MIGFIKQWRARRRQAAIIKACQRNGHFCQHSGELIPSTDGVTPSGPAEFWFYHCVCGYTEVNVPNLKDYYRPYAEAEAMIAKGKTIIPKG